MKHVAWMGEVRTAQQILIRINYGRRTNGEKTLKKK